MLKELKASPEICQRQFTLACQALKNIQRQDDYALEVSASNLALIESCVVAAGRRGFVLEMPIMEGRFSCAIRGIARRAAKRSHRNCVHG